MRYDTEDTVIRYYMDDMVITYCVMGGRHIVTKTEKLSKQ